MQRRWLALCILVALLTGCRPRDDSLVTVWSWDIAAKALQALVPGFYEQNPQFRGWRLEVLDLGNLPVVDRGMAGCAAGGVNLPDVYCLENNRAETFWNRFPSSFVDLAPLGAEALRSQYPPCKWTDLTVGPHIFALPWDSGPVVLFYRRDYFRQAGIDPASIHTWDDYLDAGVRIARMSGGRIKLATVANGVDDDWFRMLANEGGGYYFDDTCSRVTVAEPACIQAMNVIKRLADAHVLAYGAWGEQIQYLKSGAVATALYGAWFEGTIRENCPDSSGQWGIMPMPAFERGGLRAANIGGSSLAIPSTSRHQAVAWAFIRYALANVPSQIRMLREEGLVPSYLPALSDPYVQRPQPFWGNQVIWPAILQTLPQIRGTHSSPYFQEAKQIVTTVQADLLDGRYPSTEAALRDAARLISEATNVP